MLCGRVGEGRPVGVVGVETKIFKGTEALREGENSGLGLLHSSPVPCPRYFCPNVLLTKDATLHCLK